MNKVVPLIVTCAFLAGCISAPKLKTSYYSHKDHGTVNDSNPIYTADRNACQDEIYAKGVMIDGKLVKTRDEAYQAVINNMANNLETDISSSRYGGNSKRAEPEYYKTIDQYDKEVGQCNEVKGWLFVERK